MRGCLSAPIRSYSVVFTFESIDPLFNDGRTVRTNAEDCGIFRATSIPLSSLLLQLLVTASFPLSAIGRFRHSRFPRLLAVANSHRESAVFSRSIPRTFSRVISRTGPLKPASRIFCERGDFARARGSLLLTQIIIRINQPPRSRATRGAPLHCK